ncbi:hypothetical protein [Jannaschia seohaensis]|uniref:Uncharacterized protein n=1 Tax=Jannaschia seohaensis TaxID=475081 RepID=A0A2Y9AY69_9RHOB|nr:hypothetical protein [Jannaschia seohaensis]PWJ17444.1 hypothetical protein BCF38_10654 [Jannaschia seohaensis]SSA47507.1 hypothetical protein SAMN05421539_10654 [Jannaschia seohaensis]
MPQPVLAALLATALLALPAAAQTIDIDEDDGWRRGDLPAAPVSRAVTAPSGDCAQRERSAGLAPDACGPLGANAVAFLQGDN